MCNSTGRLSYASSAVSTTDVADSVSLLSDATARGVPATDAVPRMSDAAPAVSATDTALSADTGDSLSHDVARVPDAAAALSYAVGAGCLPNPAVSVGGHSLSHAAAALSYAVGAGCLPNPALPVGRHPMSNAYADLRGDSIGRRLRWWSR